MKKLLVALCLIGTTILSPAFAWNNGYRGHGYYNNGYYNNGYYNNNYWVAPALAGVAVGALAARSYYSPPPVVYVQPPVTYYQQPAPSNQGPANPPPFGYHWQYLLDGGCNCYRWAILPD